MYEKKNPIIYSKILLNIVTKYLRQNLTSFLNAEFYSLQVLFETFYSKVNEALFRKKKLISGFYLRHTV